jgi:dienelactone hydrolase
LEVLHRRAALTWIAALIGLAAHAQNTPEEARRLVDLLLTGKYAELVERFTPKMKEALSEETLRTKVAPALKAMGAVQGIEEPQAITAGEGMLYVFPVKLSNVPINVNITLDETGTVTGLYMQPRGGIMGMPVATWQRPAYSRPDAFSEREVGFGVEGWKLPGTLTVPRGEGPFPGVVLVHGSGPHDRDETIGPNKVFRDLAEGLASGGIAVLRYGKRTQVHGAKLAEHKTVTLRDETIDDAVAAAAFLAEQKDIDGKRVFVLGHSLGGFAAPSIARRHGKLAGYVVFAGNTRPLEDLVIDQMEYLLPLQIPDAEKAKTQIESIRKQVAELKKLKPGDESTLTLLGAPAQYWLDLRQYDPAAEARRLALPVLVLQGERDYQVTMQDFAGWKKALDGRAFATLKSYPALNHLFMPGQGKARPEEYQRAGHVDVKVIEDIAAWLATPVSAGTQASEARP